MKILDQTEVCYGILTAFFYNMQHKNIYTRHGNQQNQEKTSTWCKTRKKLKKNVTITKAKRYNYKK